LVCEIPGIQNTQNPPLGPEFRKSRLVSFLENGLPRKRALFVKQDDLASRQRATGVLEVRQSIRGGSGYFIQCVKRLDAPN
jgi:hypothetical protein